MPPDFLAVGHIVKDVTPEGWRPGGPVYYATAQPQRLGLSVAAVTRCGSDLDPASIVPGVDWRILPDETTTTFENHQGADGRREQRVFAQAQPLVRTDLPTDLLDAPIVFLGSVFHDIDPGLARELVAPGRVVGVEAQGWLRSNVDSRVTVAAAEAAPDWLGGDVVFLSEEDITDEAGVSRWQEHVPVVVLTRSQRGCTVWDAAGRHDQPAFETLEVDPTGAGDVFASAFLVRYHETRDPILAARFGAAAAALSVSGNGIEAVASRSAIEALLERQPVGQRQ